MDPREPIEYAPSPAQNSKFLKWWGNIWYHYKWFIIVGLFFAFTITVCIVQCAKRESYDVRLGYAGGKVLTNTEYTDVYNAVVERVPKDNDNDGKKTVQLFSYPVFDPGILAEEDKIAAQSNPKYMSEVVNLVGKGLCSVWIVSRYVYDNTPYLSDRLVPLEDSFGEKIPEYAADDYALLFRQTPFYQQNAKAFDAIFPQDEELYLLLVGPTEFEKQKYESDCQLYFALAR